MATVKLPNGELLQVPDDATPEQIQSYVDQIPAPRSTAESAARLAGNFGGGFNRSAVETVAALPELVSTGFRKVGIPAPEPGFYTNKLQSGLDAVIGAPPKPEGTAEKFAHGAGRGVADAMSVAIPAAATAQLATGPVTRGVAQALASAPAAQAAYGAIGGGVGEATDSPALGTAAAIAGPLLAGVLRNAVVPGGVRLNPEQQRLAAALEREGVNLTPAQASGSKPLKIIDAISENLPLTAGRAQDMVRSQHEQFTKAAMAKAGQDSISAAPDVIQAARGRIGGEFNALSQGRTVPLGKAVTDALDNIERAAAPLRDVLPSGRVDSMIEGARKMIASGPISGETAQTLRSELTKEAKDAAASQQTRLAGALRTFRDSIDDSIRAALKDPQDVSRWDTARRQWANLKVVEAAMKGAGEEAAAGRIPPNMLAQALKSANPRDYVAGAGDLNDLARGGQAFLRPIPSSGTAERAMWQGLLTGGPASTMMAYGDPISAAGWAGASTLLPKVAQMAIHSEAGKRALTNPNQNANSAALITALLAAQTKRALTKQAP